MSFVWKRSEGRLRTPEQVMAIIIKLVGGLNPFDKRGACICAGMCVSAESDFWLPWNAAEPTSKNYEFDSQSDDGRSVGYCQQQTGPNGELWWGPVSQEMSAEGSIGEFLKRLIRNGYNAASAQTANDSVQAVQRSGVPQGYRGHWDRINQLYDSVISGAQPPQPGGPMPVSGDPTWLEDVLRPVLGARLKTLPGWQDAGHGDYQDIRGVMVHHTGNGRASAQSIRDGRPDLEGPLSNLHIAQDGIVTIVAVGVCWHAGQGSYPWLPTDNANWHMIGIECAWPMDANNKAEPWPAAQVISMRDTCAALATKLGVDASHVIGHKEYAGAAQGKWDPGNMDMGWFRGEVAKDMRGEFNGPTPPPPAPQPGPVLPPDYDKETWDQLRIAWPQLGNQTLVNALAEVRDKVCGTTDKDKR